MGKSLRSFVGVAESANFVFLIARENAKNKLVISLNQMSPFIHVRAHISTHAKLLKSKTLIIPNIHADGSLWTEISERDNRATLDPDYIQPLVRLFGHDVVMVVVEITETLY